VERRHHITFLLRIAVHFIIVICAFSRHSRIFAFSFVPARLGVGQLEHLMTRKRARTRKTGANRFRARTGRNAVILPEMVQRNPSGEIS
jgi:hypothetical protein